MIQFLRRTADSLYWEWCQAGRCPQTLSCTAVFGIKHRCPDNCRCVCFKPWLTSGPQRDVKWQGFFFFSSDSLCHFLLSLSLSLSLTHTLKQIQGGTLTCWPMERLQVRGRMEAEKLRGHARLCFSRPVSSTDVFVSMAISPGDKRQLRCKVKWSADTVDVRLCNTCGLVDWAKREKQLRNLCECAKITSEN